jgi:hypothetical protein
MSEKPSLIEPKSESEAEREAANLIREACMRLEARDFRFSVDARGTPWDVYRITIRGRPGLVAFRLVNGVAEVGYCDLDPNVTEDEIVRILSKQAN